MNLAKTGKTEELKNPVNLELNLKSKSLNIFKRVQP
jgi:hypothetical protein